VNATTALGLREFAFDAVFVELWPLKVNRDPSSDRLTYIVLVAEPLTRMASGAVTPSTKIVCTGEALVIDGSSSISDAVVLFALAAATATAKLPVTNAASGDAERGSFLRSFSAVANSPNIRALTPLSKTPLAVAIAPATVNSTQIETK
jgi:hypothetical protein